MNSRGKFIAKYKTSLLSTGVSSLDNLLNGGLPVNTITLIEEDSMNVNCSMFCQHFISHGLCNSQETALVIDEFSPETYLENLPTSSHSKPPSQPMTDNLADLNIAWRYKMMPQLDKNDSSREPSSTIDSSKFTSHFVGKERLSDNLDDVLRFCSKFLKEKAANRRLARILIGSLGSPLWGCYDSRQEMMTLIYRFLFCLNGLLKGQTATVVMVTLSGVEQWGETAQQWMALRSLCGYVLRFEAFSDPEALASQLHNEVTGRLVPVKLPSVNSIEPILRPNTVLWSFHVFSRHTRMVFKEFSLPPCLSDNTSRSNQPDLSKTINTSKIGCGVDF